MGDETKRANKYPLWQRLLGGAVAVAMAAGAVIWLFIQSPDPEPCGSYDVMSVPANCVPGPRTQLPIGGDINGSAEESPENVLFGEPPSDLYCPDGRSREAADAEPGNRYTVGTQAKDVLVMHGGAIVHIKAGAVVTGTVRVCGGGATLILEGKLTGPALVSGGGARIILVDGRKPQGVVYLNGGGSEIIYCKEHKMQESLPPCTRYF